ncbi:unnamed protein product [Candida verbasci]|uniref:Major facilitator superfamily (MFS) profile domain-containing protein n=1 Tax=Candida verbasci TaxID=1227364 RepID=A0A9W4TZY3_9ASCO|nr:unnamed protein product [Candida verbasci]
MKSNFKWHIDTSSYPKEIFNRKLYLSIFIFGILGAARGYDEGNISGNIVLPSFKDRFGLNDSGKSQNSIANLQSNITSMVQLGSIGGALLAVKTVDFFGRVRALQIVCILWIIGAIIQITATSVGQLYAGRIIEGLAIGQTTSIGPIYIAECAVSVHRGIFGSIFAGNVYLGVMIRGYFANYGCSLHVPAYKGQSINDNQWRYTLTPKIILGGLIFIGSIFLTIESPRWLLSKGKSESALENLSKLRQLPKDHPYIVAEISDINEQIMTEKEAKEGSSMIGCIQEVFRKKSITYRFFVIAICAQLIAQWSGANAVTIYASELFSLAGIKGDSNQLKMSAVLGVVKFVAAYISSFFIIDLFGRKKALYSGVSLQMLSILYFAIFLTIVPQAANSDAKLSPSEHQASKAALAAIFLSGAGWTMGFNIIQYLIGAEIFPLNIRSFAQSTVMVIHFANQYGVMFIGLIWAFFLPELKGRSLESIEEVFTLQWYNLRRCNELVPDHSQVHRIKLTNSRGNTDYNNIQYENKESTAMNENLFSSDNSMEEDKSSKLDV